MGKVETGKKVKVKKDNNTKGCLLGVLRSSWKTLKSCLSVIPSVLLRWQVFPPGSGLDLRRTSCLRHQLHILTSDSWPLKEVPHTHPHA